MNGNSNGSDNGSNGNGGSRSARPQAGQAGRQRGRSQAEVLKTWLFDSVGEKKYALQVRKARNGNPCLRLVEGVPQSDGTFRKFHTDIWSEDFAAFFQTLDEARSYIEANDVRTPEGHKWTPRSQRKGSGRGGGRRRPAGANTSAAG